MIKGLDHFRNHFAENFDDFVVIGGVAAHEIMWSAGLEFRATKDIDLVIIARPATAVCQRLVEYIEAGEYEIRQSKYGGPAYYRFLKPKQLQYPAQLEIFSCRPDDLTLRDSQHIVPITETPTGADLSAILLEDDYFELIKSNVQLIKGLPVASTEAVIALKSRAFNDLKDRKTSGDMSVSNDEIKKHRNDIMRLSQALSQLILPVENGHELMQLTLANAHERVAWKREDFLHQTSASIVKYASFIATESLNIKAMTANGGAFKAGLNRSILDTSPGKFFELLEYKAADAGIPYIEIPTRKVKPSQTCSGCGHGAKKQLSERFHDCKPCGLVLDRDVNAALVILNFALTGFVTGREPALSVESEVIRSLKHETPSIPEYARQSV